MSEYRDRIYRTNRNYEPYNSNLGAGHYYSAFRGKGVPVAFVRNLPKTGFTEHDPIATEKGQWSTYARLGHPVTNFDAEPTITYSGVGIYSKRDEEDLDSIITRVSVAPFTPEEFSGDLKALTEAFFERSWFRGIRPKVFNEVQTPLLMVAGMPVGLVASLSLGFTDAGISLTTVGSVFLFEGPNSLGVKMGKRRLRQRIPKLGEYWAEGAAVAMIKGQETHKIDATLKEAVYGHAFIQGEETPVFTKRQFLSLIYKELPPTIVDAAKDELRGGFKYSEAPAVAKLGEIAGMVADYKKM